MNRVFIIEILGSLLSFLYIQNKLENRLLKLPLFSFLVCLGKLIVALQNPFKT
jgi:hypothetical protein